MNPSTRERLRKSWGFCERHAWGFISVEAAFRSGFMHGPAVLYEDLMARVLAAFHVAGPLGEKRMVRNLRGKVPCLMCEERFGPDTQGAINEDRVRKGRDLTELRIFAHETSDYWQEAVCGRCTGNGSDRRCRTHLIQDLARGSVQELSPHRELVSSIAKHVSMYACSFQLELRHTRSVQNAAALISAVGWCSGWRLLLSIMQ